VPSIVQPRKILLLVPDGLAKIDLFGTRIGPGDRSGAPADHRACHDTDRATTRPTVAPDAAPAAAPPCTRPGSVAPQPASKVTAPAQMSLVIRFMVNAFASMSGTAGPQDGWLYRPTFLRYIKWLFLVELQ
jgi:hypothetical protein